jgi:hypothetical protein
MSFAPECQFANCEAEATESVEHDEFGTVQVCATCANLWGGGDD